MVSAGPADIASTIFASLEYKHTFCPTYQVCMTQGQEDSRFEMLLLLVLGSLVFCESNLALARRVVYRPRDAQAPKKTLPPAPQLSSVPGTLYGALFLAMRYLRALKTIRYVT